jgi:phage shock protein PspC (stress-responsive transcriptional regulator)
MQQAIVNFALVIAALFLCAGIGVVVYMIAT